MMTEQDEYRTYTNHLQAEHHRHRDRLLRVDLSLQQGIRQASELTELSANLTALRDELAKHFEREEWGGYSEEAVCRVPGSLPEFTRLSRQRREVMAGLDTLIESLPRQSLSRGEFDQLQIRYVKFVTSLDEYEAAERKLLERCFGIAID
jgi:hypothetical protein